MTDQKLIERLRAVIETATSDAYTAASQMNVTASDHASTERDVTEAEAVRDLVVAALEKAYTPTGDDREALLSAIINAPESGDALHVAEAERVRDAVLAAGFRRPVSEPSTEDAAVTLTTEAVEANREYIERTAEPQGEPSDAQVRAAALAWIGSGEPDEMTLWNARAALRAAAEAGGEGR